MKSAAGTLIALILLLFFAGAARSASVVIPFDEALSYKNISSGVEYIEDARKKIVFEEVLNDASLRWEKSGRDYINFGYTKSQFWFRFTADNRSGKVLPWLLEIDFPPIDLIELYYPDGSGRYLVKKTGDSLPFGSRDIENINYIFKMNQKPGPMTCYIRIDSADSVNFNLNMFSGEYFLKRLNADMPIYWVFFGLMAVMALYNLIIFISTRDLEHLFFTCFVITYALFEFNFKGFASQYLWPNAGQWTSRANPFLVSLVIMFVTLFLYKFTGFRFSSLKSRRLSSRMMGYGIISLSLGCLVLAVFSLYANVQTSLMLVYMVASLNILANVGLGIYLSFFIKRRSRQAKIALLAFAPFSISVPVVILTMMGILPANFFTRWALQFGTSMAVVLLSFGMADKINFMKNTIQVGERKYRHLVESTGDIIFTLDDDNRVLSVNNAVKEQLGFNVSEVVNTNFLDLVQEAWNAKNNIARQVVIEYISDLKRKKKGSVQFRTTMKQKYSHEPRELAVSLEYTGDRGTGYAILGKAAPIIDDALSQFLEKEDYSYNINNYLGNAELMSQRLVRNLYKFAHPLLISEIRLALREAIINSIEHGNLALSFDEKTSSQINGTYFELVKERQVNPVLREKKVRVEYTLDEKFVEYKITDEGEGFDHASMTKTDPGADETIGLEHGRGLVMIMSCFDVVTFNEKGNQIILVKYFKKP